jgi:hypothetical protein
MTPEEELFNLKGQVWILVILFGILALIFMKRFGYEILFNIWTAISF